MQKKSSFLEKSSPKVQYLGEEDVFVSIESEMLKFEKTLHFFRWPKR